MQYQIIQRQRTAYQPTWAATVNATKTNANSHLPFLRLALCSLALLSALVSVPAGVQVRVAFNEEVNMEDVNTKKSTQQIAYSSQCRYSISVFCHGQGL